MFSFWLFVLCRKQQVQAENTKIDIYLAPHIFWHVGITWNPLRFWISSTYANMTHVLSGKSSKIANTESSDG